MLHDIMELSHQQLVLHIDGLVQGRRNPSVLAMELRLSCNNPIDICEAIT